MTGKNINLEILSNHYSETFSLLKEAVARRDRIFLYILGLIFLLLLYINAPSSLSNWLSQLANSQSGNNQSTELLLDSSFIGAVLLFGLLSLAHTYFQTVLHIERQYDYVYSLEKQLSQNFENKAFIREGAHYKKSKRKFAAWTKMIFWYLFPLLFLAFNITWMIFLFTKSNATSVYKIIDSLIIVSITISLYFYLLALIKKK